eukprot:6213451-Pleurochrysis_carterae.AAC.4
MQEVQLADPQGVSNAVLSGGRNIALRAAGKTHTQKTYLITCRATRHVTREVLVKRDGTLWRL